MRKSEASTNAPTAEPFIALSAIGRIYGSSGPPAQQPRRCRPPRGRLRHQPLADAPPLNHKRRSLRRLPPPGRYASAHGRSARTVTGVVAPILGGLFTRALVRLVPTDQAPGARPKHTMMPG